MRKGKQQVGEKQKLKIGQVVERKGERVCARVRVRERARVLRTHSVHAGHAPAALTRPAPRACVCVTLCARQLQAAEAELHEAG